VFQIVLTDQHDILHQRPHHLARQHTGGLDRDAFGNRVAMAYGLFALERRRHRRVALGLHADDLNAR
jgi:hypothetical protein